jgi:hypothetical protein
MSASDSSSINAATSCAFAAKAQDLTNFIEEKSLAILRADASRRAP